MIFSTKWYLNDSICELVPKKHGDDRGLSGIQTSDEGYAIAGYTSSGGSNSSNILFIKTDDNGNSDSSE